MPVLRCRGLRQLSGARILAPARKFPRRLSLDLVQIPRVIAKIISRSTKTDPTLAVLRISVMLHRRDPMLRMSGALPQTENGVTVLDKPRVGSAGDAVERNVSEPRPAATTKLSQETLWMLAVRDHGDKQAFAQLFDHFAPRLKGLFIRNGMSPAQAEDILQDTMLSVWRKAAQFDPTRAQVSGWIYQVARNRQIDIIRKEKRPLPEALKVEDTTEPDASEAVALEQETRKLRDALMTLPTDQRAVLEKAYLGELTHKDIQIETGLPLGTIKSRIRLGLERLRHEFSKTKDGI